MGMEPLPGLAWEEPGMEGSLSSIGTSHPRSMETYPVMLGVATSRARAQSPGRFLGDWRTKATAKTTVSPPQRGYG